jgi:hypothetical protein
VAALGGVDLITVAEPSHWFNLLAFYNITPRPAG